MKSWRKFHVIASFSSWLEYILSYFDLLSKTFYFFLLLVLYIFISRTTINIVFLNFRGSFPLDKYGNSQKRIGWLEWKKNTTQNMRKTQTYIQGWRREKRIILFLFHFFFDFYLFFFYFREKRTKEIKEWKYWILLLLFGLLLIYCTF